MVHWGVGLALLGVKSAVCVLLVLLRYLGTHPISAWALTLWGLGY